jgi:probable F420-dependent oxidoreductase
MRDYVRAVRAIWHSWQNETPLDFASKHYNLNLNVPLFTPDPIDNPDIPIQVAAVNPYMCRVAAEESNGVRLHPVCSAKYIRDCLEPEMVRRTPGFEVCLKPLIATAADDATLAQRMEVARSRLAFYVSTPAYRRAFSNAGLEDLAIEMSQLSKGQEWAKMSRLINDDVLHEWVVVAPYEKLAETILARYGGLIDRIEVSIPVNNETDEAVLRDIVHALQSA